MWMTLMVLLGIFSYFDLKEKRLPLWLLVIAVMFSTVAAVVMGVAEGDFLPVFFGMLPGALLCLLSAATRGKIGCGDGLVLLIIGNLAGIKWTWIILLLSIGGAFLFSCFLLAIGRKSRNDTFPFVPFYLGSALIGCFWR